VTVDRPTPHGEDREGSDLLRRLGWLAPASPEPDYERFAAYAFVRRYVEGKVVADVAYREIGWGTRLLAGTAARVAGMTRSAEWAELASATYPASNAGYETAELPALPHPENSFDVVVALGVLEHLEQPEDLLKDARRVLKGDGVLVISVPDKDHDARKQGGMYALEAEEMLGRHFGAVRLYRHGAVAGGFVGPYSGKLAMTGVQGFHSSAVDPTPQAGSPATRSIVAVCGETEIPEAEPFLLLDGDRRVFEEHEDLARDVKLMWDEVDRMQETETQSFQDTLKLFKSEVSYLRAQVRRSETRVRRSETRVRQLESQAARLQDRIRGMENSATWRVFEPYRQLRSKIDAARRSDPKSKKETDDSSRT